MMTDPAVIPVYYDELHELSQLLQFQNSALEIITGVLLFAVTALMVWICYKIIRIFF